MAPKRRGGGGGSKGFFRDRQQQQQGNEKPLIYKPREHYPTTSTPKLIPLRKVEIARIEHFRVLRKAHHDGPLYTVLDPSARVSKPSDLPGMRSFGYSTAQAAQNAAINTKEVNPFDALPTFSQKYKKPRRPVPKLEDGGYIKTFFPLELHQYIDPSSAPQTSSASKMRSHLTGTEEEELLEEEEALMEEEDDDFEDDEDDDDDYNAEQYFSDGKSDAGGDEGGGGGDDY
jgi:DNA-directed RNA polymerase III subunit RPC7